MGFAVFEQIKDTMNSIPMLAEHGLLCTRCLVRACSNRPRSKMSLGLPAWHRVFEGARGVGREWTKRMQSEAIHRFIQLKVQVDTVNTC